MTTFGLPLDHVGIAVWSLEVASRPYLLLGLEQDGEDEEVEQQGVRVRLLRAGHSLIELLEPTHAESPVQRYLDKRGAGMHHLALRIRNLNSEITRLSQEGARFISTEPRPGRHGSRIAFLHPQWTGGVLVELVEYP